jgi:ATP-dependent DNA helicase RecG
VYEEIKQELQAGRQAYIICPLIEESEAVEATSATTEYKVLAEQVFPEFSVGLLHGRMKAAEKEAVMESFRQGKHHILVSTTVIEVGVDVPNATVMLVQDANRFGLSQLHQLRGRVGRGGHQSRCIFMADAKSTDGMRRLKAIAELSDGFDVAEEDLQIRGPGDYFGLRQSGFPEFQVADLTRDLLLLEQAREDALALVRRDPELEQEPVLKRQLRIRAERTAELVH